MAKIIITVDLGGTRLRAAQVDSDLRITKRCETLTKAHEGLDPTLQRMKDIIREVLPDDEAKVIGIGVSAAGPTNPKTGVVVAPPNLDGWHDVPLADILSKEFGVPVYVGNDANVAALAEASVGTAKGYRDAIYLTVSTGIGSGIISDGRLVLGKSGIGGEAGHMIMVVDKNTVSTLEKEAAGPALARKARQRIADGEKSILVEMANGNLEAIDSKMIGTAANQGDVLAVSIVKDGAKIVGLGIVSLLLLFNPEVVVIGGGVSYIGDIWFNKIRETVREYALDDEYWKDTPIIPSNMSEDVGIIGAATLVITQGGRKRVTKVAKNISVE
ncbi:MAG: ROK family protein [Anaerolineae bacterium]|nr:ROK family protein [Anaerolineae bacterium]